METKGIFIPKNPVQRMISAIKVIEIITTTIIKLVSNKSQKLNQTALHIFIEKILVKFFKILISFNIFYTFTNTTHEKIICFTIADSTICPAVLFII
jgi:hypothetical protein